MAFVGACFDGAGEVVAVVIGDESIDEVLIDVEHESVVVGRGRFGLIDFDSDRGCGGHGDVPRGRLAIDGWDIGPDCLRS